MSSSIRTEPADENSDWTDLRDKLYARANSLDLYSHVYLTAIVMLLILAAFVFVFAQKVTDLDLTVQVNEKLEPLKARYNSLVSQEALELKEESKLSSKMRLAIEHILMLANRDQPDNTVHISGSSATYRSTHMIQTGFSTQTHYPQTVTCCGFDRLTPPSLKEVGDQILAQLEALNKTDSGDLQPVTDTTYSNITFVPFGSTKADWAGLAKLFKQAAPPLTSDDLVRLGDLRKSIDKE